MGRKLQMRGATTHDLDWIHEVRHRVYAEELAAAPTNATGVFSTVWTATTSTWWWHAELIGSGSSV